MAYNDALLDNQNWVRFLTDDTSATPINSDAEIDAVLAEIRITDANGALKYAAAALCYKRILTKYLKVAGQGLKQKWVDDLKLTYGSDDNVTEAIRAEIKDLKREAARLSRGTPRRIKVVRHPKVSGVEVNEVGNRVDNL